jgi:hypothetical protein
VLLSGHGWISTSNRSLSGDARTGSASGRDDYILKSDMPWPDRFGTRTLVQKASSGVPKDGYAALELIAKSFIWELDDLIQL